MNWRGFRPIFVNTIPKSGTHLAMKALELAGCRWEGGVNSHFGDFWPFDAPAKIIDDDGNLETQSLWMGGEWATSITDESARQQMDVLFRKSDDRRFFGGHMLFHPRLRRLVPWRARMIVVFRDPRAVAVSHAHWMLDSPGHPSRGLYEPLTMEERIKTSILGTPPHSGQVVRPAAASSPLSEYGEMA